MDTKKKNHSELPPSSAPPQEPPTGESFVYVQNLIAKEFIDRGIDREIGWLKRGQTYFNGVTTGITIVFFLASIAFIVDAWRFHALSYREFTEEIQELRRENQALRNMKITPSESSPSATEK